jgi:hypothetical protein
MARGRSRKSRKMVGEDPRDEYLSLFVLDANDNPIGESIGVEGDRIVIKNGKDFFRVPLKSFEVRERSLRAILKIDWEKAKKEGEIWKRKELDPLWSDE